MIRSVAIRGLRGIREGNLPDLAPLVVLVGPNGAGKSTVLDAMMIGASPVPADAIGQAAVRREGLSRGGRWLLWKGGREGPALIIVGAFSQIRTCSLTLGRIDQNTTTIDSQFTEQTVDTSGELKWTDSTEFHSNQSYSAPGNRHPLNGIDDVRFIDPHFSGLKTPLHQLYTRVVEQGLRGEAKAFVGTLIDGLEDIQILTEGDLPVLYLVFKDRAIPAALAGDGIRLLLQMAFELVTSRGGVVLLEEPEVHLHPGAIRLCARAIVAAVRRFIQVIVTTHSLELIDALVSECSDYDLQRLSLYSLQLDAGVLKHFRMAGPDVAVARTQIQDDLR